MKIAIVGGGPAGAHLGYCLAKEGIKATIFDHSHPREKPCGGGISALAMKKFAFLRDLYYESNDEWLKLISPKGRVALIGSEEETMAVSRKRMDMFILERARAAGANLVEEKVVDFGRAKDGDGWVIKTDKRLFRADLVVGADGVNSMVRRKMLGPIPKRNLCVCYGCFARSPRHADEITTIRFLEGMEGYAWSFPREDDLSIGVGVEASRGGLAKGEFERFVREYAGHVRQISVWGALLPVVKDPKFFDLPVSGDGWLLAGDAAGHVDPITGEDITYALWSAELAAKAIASGEMESFEAAWKKAYGSNLWDGSMMRRFFFNGIFLETIVKLSSRSETFGNIVCGLINSEQDYLTVGKIFAKKLPGILSELL